MKMKSTYVNALLVFAVIILLTLVYQYPHYRFQLYNVNDLSSFVYASENEDLQVSDYFAAETDQIGGGEIVLTSKTSKIASAQVTLESGKILTHKLSLGQEGHYLMDVLDNDGDISAPVSIEVLDEEGKTVASGNFTVSAGNLYQAQNNSYAFYNIYINQTGIFGGQFAIYDRAYLIDHYDMVTLEFCHPDASKSSGYALLARSRMSLESFLERQWLGYLPFVNNADFDRTRPVELMMTFEGQETKTIVMSLEKEAG